MWSRLSRSSAASTSAHTVIAPRMSQSRSSTCVLWRVLGASGLRSATVPFARSPSMSAPRATRTSGSRWVCWRPQQCHVRVWVPDGPARSSSRSTTRRRSCHLAALPDWTSSGTSQSMSIDLLIHGGLVADGTGRPPFEADVLVDQGSIVDVGHFDRVEAQRTIDASGQLVVPGFIDIHSHSDFTLLVDPTAKSALHQGVTTELVGNCGHGCAPITEPDLFLPNIYGYSPRRPLTWRTMAGYLDALEQARPAINVCSLVPNGNLRLATLGLDD